MEKRVLLATTLSFLVIIGWSLLFPPQPPQPISNEVSEEQNNNIVQNLNDVSESFLEAASEIIPETKEPLAEEFALQTPQVELVFSTEGSGINKVFLKQYNESLPISGLPTFPLYQQQTFNLIESNETRAVLALEQSNYHLQRTLEYQDDYLLKLTDTITNKTNNLLDLGKDSVAMHIDVSRLDISSDVQQIDYRLHEYFVIFERGHHRENNFFELKNKENESTNEVIRDESGQPVKEFRLKKNLDREEEGSIDFVGYRTRYFNFLVKPLFNAQQYVVEKESNQHVQLMLEENQQLSPGETKEFSYLIFVGPEDVELLKQYDEGFEKTQLYYEFVFFDATAKIIGFILKMINKVVPNWGICIFLISLLIYSSMYPLTKRGWWRCVKRKKSQPEMVRIKEKYKITHKNNKQKCLPYTKEKVLTL